MPSFSRNGGTGMFDNLKNRLGLGGKDDSYGDYDDYDGYGYEDDYDAYADNFDDFSTYEDNRSNRDDSRYGEVVERDASARRTRRSYTDAASSDLDERRRSSGNYTPLVSIDDIRANTPKLSATAPSTARSGSLVRHEFRSSDYMASGSLEREFIPEGNGVSPASDDASKRSAGYDSLFSSTTVSGKAADNAEEGSVPRASRKITVVAPREYADVERISSALKVGDVVVLDLKSTPSSLSKRALDFSFGVASALDAKVDCIADKVFAITRFAALNDAERSRLHGQGVL